jgi:hypothetical protein
MDLDERHMMRNETDRISSGSTLRKWARSYVLAGRIAAGIFQAVPNRQLPQSYAYVRGRREEEGLVAASERIGNVVLTIPLDACQRAGIVKDTRTNGRRAESPLSLPRLSRHR